MLSLLLLQLAGGTTALLLVVAGAASAAARWWSQCSTKTHKAGPENLLGFKFLDCALSRKNLKEQCHLYVAVSNPNRK